MSTSLNPAIERFAQLVDLDSPPVFLDGGDPRMRPAVTLAAALRGAAATSAPAPLSSSARLAMRERLVAAASAAPETAMSPSLAARVSNAAGSGPKRAKEAGNKLGRRLSTLVGSVMVLTSVAGVGVATARSLPGSPFYDLKRATEAIQLWATSGEAAKGQRHLEFARTRMAEAAKLPKDSPYLASTLKAMNNETQEASSELVHAYRQTGSVQPLADLVRFARKQYTELSQLGTALPETLHKDAAYSALLLNALSAEVRNLTTGVCKACVVGAQQPDPGPILAPSPKVTPGTHATSPATVKTTPSTKPSSPASSHPTHLLPSLPPLLHDPGSTTAPGKPLPTLSPLPLLSSLAQLLGQ